MLSARLLRRTYTAVLYTLLPILVLRLLWRSRKNPGYRNNIMQRFGFIKPSEKPSIWLHAVSVGETLAVMPLIKKLLSQHPNHNIIITNTTPTGAAMVCQQLGDSVIQNYFPFDLPSFIRRFVKRGNIKLCIVMETELWPNLLKTCQADNIPIILANARMSEKSKNKYLKILSITQEMLPCFSMVAAQTAADAKRLITLGLPKEKANVTGNLKFDCSRPKNLAAQRQHMRQEWLIEQRPVWMVASTHEGEDKIIIDAFKQVIKKNPGTLLIIAPRHPEQFKPVEQLCRQAGLNTITRSSKQPPATSAQVLIGDTLGELTQFFPACDIVFMGGSLVNVGGHNMIEPALARLPILTGSILHNFVQVSQLLLQAGAALITNNANEIADAVNLLLADEQRRQAMGKAAQAVIEANTGALERQLTLINEQLSINSLHRNIDQ